MGRLARLNFIISRKCMRRSLKKMRCIVMASKKTTQTKSLEISTITVLNLEKNQERINKQMYKLNCKK